MLIFHSHCQICNQMFIYACARSLAKKRNLSYCISNLYDLKYFNLPFSDIIFNNFKFLVFRLLNFLHLKKYKFCHYQDNRNDYSEVLLTEKEKNVWYYGYFQGVKYMYDNTERFIYKNSLRNCFT